MVLGFLQICSGVVLLQLSKSAKDVPDAAVFKGDLDQVRTVAEQEEPESEPKADAIRGTAAIIRRFSQSRQKTEALEARRVFEERMKDQMEPIGENEQVEWDGLKRRKTTISGQSGSVQRRKSLHPPLGMTHFPDEDDLESRPASSDVYGSGGFGGGFMKSFKKRAHNKSASRQGKALSTGTDPSHPMPSVGVEAPPHNQIDTSYQPQSQLQQSDGSMEMEHVYGLPPGLNHHAGDAAVDGARSPSGGHGKPIMWADNLETRPSSSRGSLAPAPPQPPPHAAKRQFSFQNVFHRNKPDVPTTAAADSTQPYPPNRPSSRLGHGSRHSSKDHTIPGLKSATEEERLGLVKGDSQVDHMLPLPDYAEVNSDEDDDWQLEGKPTNTSTGTSSIPLIREEKESEGSGSGSGMSSPVLQPGLLHHDAGGGGGGGSRGSGPAFL